ncbi:MAG: VOC family protein [SAR202 cluster bacterium]|nr:VOC family protein [SAR202 cluster bacterium]
MEPRISMITLGVSDLERALRFYRDGLGLPVRGDAGGGVAFFVLHGTWLSLFPRAELAKDTGVKMEGRGYQAFSLAYNVRNKADVKPVLEQAVAAGATLVKPAQDVFWGGHAGYFADPDGFLWEVAWNPHFWVGPEALT